MTKDSEKFKREIEHKDVITQTFIVEEQEEERMNLAEETQEWAKITRGKGHR